jgi:hypothetical protein
MRINKMEQNQNAHGAPEKVHSKMVRAGKKNYFFDVKKASNGSHYLTIAESYQKQDGQRVINRLMVFRDHVGEFEASLAEAKAYL